MGSNTSEGDATRLVLDGVRRIVHALHTSSRSSEREVGMSGAQLFVLRTLAETPALSLNALAARTHTHQSSVSTVVTRLVARGLVRRTASAEDGRRIELTVSPAGRRLAARAPHAAQERLVWAVDRLPAGRRRSLALSLTQVAHAMDDAPQAQAPRMFFEDRRPSRSVRRG